METTPQALAIINEMLEPLTESLTAESAGALATMKAPESTQMRVEQLASKANEGRLSEAEKSEYEIYVSIGNVLAMLKAKAKSILNEKE